MNNNQRKINSVVKKLTTYQQKFWGDIEDLGNQVREEIVLPICRTYNLEFISGNGTFFFITKEGSHIIGVWELEEDSKWKRKLEAVFALLNTEVVKDHHLGFYVSQVSEKDWKNSK